MLRRFASHDRCQLQEIGNHQVDTSFGGRLLHHDTGAVLQRPGDKAGVQTACRSRLKIRSMRRHEHDLARCTSEQDDGTEIGLRSGLYCRKTSAPNTASNVMPAARASLISSAT